MSLKTKLEIKKEVRSQDTFIVSSFRSWVSIILIIERSINRAKRVESERMLAVSICATEVG